MSNWSREEAELIVSDYFHMLTLELKGESFNKSEHRTRLKKLLSNRTDGSIERKHQNISAILLELGYPAIDGYKPLRNYQSLLFDVVCERLEGQNELRQNIKKASEEPISIPSVEDMLAILQDAPRRPKDAYPIGRKVKSRPEILGKKDVDYIALEARNSSLGDRGEEFVIRFEKARLISSGRENLADQIQHVARTEGPSAGFDIRSFESTGKDRLIEVKTTRYGRFTPFYVTKNELLTSIEKSNSYYLYRLFLFQSKPGLFWLPGQIDRSCLLDPVQYTGNLL